MERLVTYIVASPFERVNNPIEGDMADALRDESETWTRNLGHLAVGDSRRGTLRFESESVSTTRLTREAQSTHD